MHLAARSTSLALFLAAASAARAQPSATDFGPDPGGVVKRGLNSATVVEKLDARVPTDLAFLDEQGRPVTLGELLATGKPTVLQLGYYECPMLCGLQARGLADGLGSLPEKLGSDFQIVSVSIDPRETPALAQQKEASYARELGLSQTERDGWHFLTTPDDATVRALADAVGFGYAYLSEIGEYSHPAVLVYLAPDGRVARYAHGTKYASAEMSAALANARDGTSGEATGFLQRCFVGMLGKYSPLAMGLLQATAGLTVVGVLGVMGPAWYRSYRESKAQESKTADAAGTP